MPVPLNPYREYPGGRFDPLPGMPASRLPPGKFFSQGLSIPGTNPDDGLQGGVLFGFPDEYPTLPKEAYIQVPGDKPGRARFIPKGFYTTEVEDDFGASELGFGNFFDPFSLVGNILRGTGARGKTKSKISGINIPIPGSKPVTLQFRKEELSNLEKALNLGLRNGGTNLPQRSRIYDSILNNLKGDERAVNLESLPSILRRVSSVRPDYWGNMIQNTIQDKNFLGSLTTRLMEALKPAFTQAIQPRKPGYAWTDLLDQNADSTSVFLGGIPGLKPLYVGGFLNEEEKTNS